MTTDLTRLRVWPRHLYSAPCNGRIGFCARGARAWWAAHDLVWSDFVSHGIDAATLVATGDPLALALVRHAQEQEGATDGQ